MDKELIHKPLKEEIFEALHRQIIAGKYIPGDWLRQEEIAGKMGVSMTPVREALDLLVATGLAERVPYRGVRVPEMSPTDVVEAYGLRLVLEAISAREAADLITVDQIQGLTDKLEEMKQHVTLNEMPRARQLSREFHLAIVEAAGDALLTKLYAIVANAFPDWLLYEAMYRHPELLEASIAEEQKEHKAIVDALGKHDAEEAVRKSVGHVLGLGRGLEELLKIPVSLVRNKEKTVALLMPKQK
jgi:DNA-binding GntR family transcriptional regulator